jgi:S1-C subfamily serine protease
MGYSILRGRLFTVAVILAATGCQALAQEGAKAGNPAGWLGVMLGPPRVENREESAGIPPGVVVTGVVESGPADRAGIRSKDRIVSVDGSAVASAEELIATVKRLAPDTWVSLSIDRRGKPIELRARLGLRPSTLSDLRPVRGWIGAEAIDLTPSLRKHFGAPEDAGVMVSDVEEGSPAEAGGLRIGDVVYSVDDEPVRRGSELLRLIAGSGVGNPVEIRLARSGAQIVLEVLVERSPDPPTRDRS